MKFLRTFGQNQSGATAIEYGLIAALIAVAAITAMGSLGKKTAEQEVETAAPLQAEPAAQEAPTDTNPPG